jgi:hypothetical protein
MGFHQLEGSKFSILIPLSDKRIRETDKKLSKSLKAYPEMSEGSRDRIS